MIISAANVRNLMLDDEVVEAVRQGRFHVWAVRTIDEGLELLTGRPAEDVHELAARRLASYAEHLRSFTVAGDGAAKTV